MKLLLSLVLCATVCLALPQGNRFQQRLNQQTTESATTLPEVEDHTRTAEEEHTTVVADEGAHQEDNSQEDNSQEDSQEDTQESEENHGINTKPNNQKINQHTFSTQSNEEQHAFNQRINNQNNQNY